MTMAETIISADSHVIEVPDLWENGVPASFKDRAPKAYFDALVKCEDSIL